jgi:hypothetical protein
MDCSVIKFDSSGQIIWQKIYGLTGKDNIAGSIASISDGGFIVTEFPVIIESGVLGGLMRLDSDGNVIWQVSYDNWMPGSVIQTSDGEFIVAGVSIASDSSIVDCSIIKFTADGILKWQKTYGGSGMEYAVSIQQTNDGGYIVDGFSNSTDIPDVTNYGGFDFYIIKLDASGEVQWQKMYGGSGDDMSGVIIQTSDDGYIVAGTSNSIDIPGVANHGLNDIYVLRLGIEGDIIWERMYGGSGEENCDFNLGLLPIQDNGFIISGKSSSTDIAGVVNHGDYDAYIIKVNADGEIGWHNMYGGSAYDCARSVITASDGGYIIVGSSTSTDIEGTANHGQSDAYVLKIDPSGNQQ